MTEYIESELQMHSKLIMFIENEKTKRKLFVGWSETDNYYVRGIDETQNVPFGFYINSLEDCFNFIQLFNNSFYSNIIVYNYNNMMYLGIDELTYDFFESQREEQYALLKHVNDNDIVKVLKMLKHCYNYYEEEDDE